MPNIACRAAQCLPVPDGLPLDQAAALPETLFTVWHNVFERGWACEGNHPGPRRHQRHRQHGDHAGQAVRADRDRHLRRAGQVRGGAAHRRGSRDRLQGQRFRRGSARDHRRQGVNLVLDMVAGDYVARNIQCLAMDGRHVTIAVQGGAKAQINMAQVMSRRLTLTGSTLRARSASFKALLTRKSRRPSGRWWNRASCARSWTRPSPWTRPPPPTRAWKRAPHRQDRARGGLKRLRNAGNHARLAQKTLPFDACWLTSSRKSGRSAMGRPLLFPR
jgi:hypothetical protein